MPKPSIGRQVHYFEEQTVFHDGGWQSALVGPFPATVMAVNDSGTLRLAIIGIGSRDDDKYTLWTRRDVSGSPVAPVGLDRVKCHWTWPPRVDDKPEPKAFKP